MAATAGLENNDDTQGAEENGKREVAEKKCKMVGEGTHFYKFHFLVLHFLCRVKHFELSRNFILR